MGAAKPSAFASAGASCTRPSVVMTAPATRSGGTSASAAPSAVKSRVPSVSPSDCPASTTRTSSPGMRRSRSSTAARASSVCRVRSPKFWLRLLSTTTTAPPRLRETIKSSASTTAAAIAAHNIWSGTRGVQATPRFTSVLLLPEPFEQRRHVHLVGFVVAGQRVHDDVDAGAERKLALPRLAFDHGQHGLAVRPRRPGAGKIVRSNDDRGYAVAAARRTTRRLCVLARRQRLHPELAGIEAAGEVAQQIERLGQNVLARHRLELGDVERGGELAQFEHARAAGLATGT